jgi:transcriptional regulator with XRE-family HTH domain
MKENDNAEMPAEQSNAGNNRIEITEGQKHETNKFPERLITAMRNKHYSVSVLAVKTGIDKGSISNYRAGRYLPKYDRMGKLAAVLQVDEAWLSGKDTLQVGETFVSETGMRLTSCRLTDKDILVLNRYHELDENVRGIVDKALRIEEVLN